uniref:PGG domain-containing protein n=1 Tax=Oryza brachyantha TaxID=4533 RepID=J3MWM7_ORYBR
MARSSSVSGRTGSATTTRSVNRILALREGVRPQERSDADGQPPHAPLAGGGAQDAIVSTIWPTVVFFFAMTAQMPSTFVEQGKAMDTRVGPVDVPSATLSTFELQWLDVGLVLSALAMAYSTLLEASQRATDAPTSIMWQALPYIMLGAVEVFISVGLIKFYYDQTQDTMKSMCKLLIFVAVQAATLTLPSWWWWWRGCHLVDIPVAKSVRIWQSPKGDLAVTSSTAISSPTMIEVAPPPQPSSRSSYRLPSDLGTSSSSSLLEGTTFQGDSALHVVATGGDDDDNLQSADLIYGKAKHLLEATNNNGDTAIHCAARAANVEMAEAKIRLLRKQNHQHETVLHEAVRRADKALIEELMEEDPELARHPSDATLPLYLAVILLDDLEIATKLQERDRKLSYSGPNGQNALHAAVHRTIEATKMILDWNKDLAGKCDKDGWTPLHFAVSIEPSTKIPYYYKPLFFILHYIDRYGLYMDWLLYSRKTSGDVDSTTLTGMLLDADESSAYQPNDMGSFPIHVAAAEGRYAAINILLNRSPNSATLCNAQGRTFLHVAVEERRYNIIMFVRQRRWLASRIVNMQDNDGNTVLHLAVQAGDLQAVLCLLANPRVEIDCLNNEGLTPLDNSVRLRPEGLHHGSHQQIWIDESLGLANAKHGNPCVDHRQEKCICKKVAQKGDSGTEEDKKDDHQQEDSKTITESTQVMGVCSTLIATVAFAAAFTLPGGYRADDRINGGTPTFVGSYAFGAFVLAITFAFIFSLLATFSLVYSGMAKVDYKIRLGHLNSANTLIWLSIRCLLAAFALGLYVVLAPVATILPWLSASCVLLGCCTGTSLSGHKFSSQCSYMEDLRCGGFWARIYFETLCIHFGPS